MLSGNRLEAADFIVNVPDGVRRLLEDFHVVSHRANFALVSGHAHRTRLLENVHAAVVASSLCLKSIDYAKKHYCEGIAYPDGETENTNPAREYVYAYQAAKTYITAMLAKLETTGKPLPQWGVYGASVVLTRLPASFFSAHLLYSLGQRYEGHAVARLILEQLAWAAEAAPLNTLDELAKIQTTKSIHELEIIYPDAGLLYGFLSKKTHVSYESHGSFLRVIDGVSNVLYAEPEHDEYASTILRLADIFGVVWEYTQKDYMPNFEAVRLNGEEVHPAENRPFKTTMLDHLQRIKAAKEEENRSKE